MLGDDLHLRNLLWVTYRMRSLPFFSSVNSLPLKSAAQRLTALSAPLEKVDLSGHEGRGDQCYGDTPIIPEGEGDGEDDPNDPTSRASHMSSSSHHPASGHATPTPAWLRRWRHMVSQTLI